MNAAEIEQLKKIGNEWSSADGSKHRIYFNDLEGLYGLKCQYYNSGNISSATFRGEKISNTTAREYQDKFAGDKKIWFDINSGTFESKGFDKLPKSLAYIIEQIKNRVA